MVLPSTLPVAPLPVGEFESLDVGKRQVSLLRRADDGVGQRVFARPLNACRQPEKLGLLKSGCRHDRNHLRLALGQRAGLVDYQRVDLFHALQRFGVLDENAGLRAAADTDHDRHRRGKAERAGAGDDENADRRNQPERHSRLRSEPRPGAKGDQRHGDHDRHEPAGNLVRQSLDRRARALRFRNHLDDLRQQGVAPDLVGAHHEAAGLIEGTRDHLGAGLLRHRHRFSGHQRFIERGAAFEDHTVDRHLLAGADAQFVADGQAVDLDLMVGAVLVDAPRGLGRQLQERLDCAGCRLAGAKLENLSEQYQHGNDGRGFEIDRNRAAMAAKRLREDIRRDGADHAVDIGDARAHRDQGEHVEIARQQRLPAAHEERPARP